MPIPLILALAALTIGGIVILMRRRDEDAEPETPPSGPSARHDRAVYPPNAPETVALYEDAARLVGVPVAWARSPALHTILKKESGGRVGIPNYTYKPRSDDPKNWPAIWAELRQGKYTGGKIKSGKYEGQFSSATGLGQLTLPNVKLFYPGATVAEKLAGIGDPLSEAAGQLAYIKSRHQTPENALRKYGTEHEGY